MSLRKPDIRVLIRHLRRCISADYRRRSSLAAAQHLMHSIFFKKAKHIAAYMPTPHEFDSFPIIQAIWAANKHCYLPVINAQQRLDFVCYTADTPLKRNCYQVLEPATDTHTQEMPPAALDVILLPLVAYDAQGNRLGSGSGYYDRSLTFMLETQPRPIKPHLIGLAYALQKVEHVPREAFDVPLEAVLSEDGLLLCS